MTFDEAFDRLLGHEGGYSNDPADPGGETMWGVTKRVAQADGYTGAMRDFPRERAKVIYQRQYWAPCRAEELPDALKFDVFDAAVNSGVEQSVKWLQEAIGAAIDGKPGPLTIGMAQQGNSSAKAARFNGIRLQFMTDRNTWANFSRGWARRIASNLKAQKD